MQFLNTLKNANTTNERISSVLHAGLAVIVGLATLAAALNSAALWS